MKEQMLVAVCNVVTSTPPGGTRGPVCHEKRGSHEAPGKSAKTSGAKVCPYSHPSSQNSSGTSPGNPHSTSDLCKTTPKHFKTMCRRPTPPGVKLAHLYLFITIFPYILKDTSVEVQNLLAERLFLDFFCFSPRRSLPSQ